METTKEKYLRWYEEYLYVPRPLQNIIYYTIIFGLTAIGWSLYYLQTLKDFTGDKVVYVAIFGLCMVLNLHFILRILDSKIAIIAVANMIFVILALFKGGQSHQVAFIWMLIILCIPSLAYEIIMKRWRI